MVDDSFSITSFESNLSVSSEHGTSSASIDQCHWLCTCSCRREVGIYHSHRVGISDEHHSNRINSLSSCVISTMCVAHLEYQRINPTTQVALFSRCVGRCSSLSNITWMIYQGVNRTSTNIQWMPFNQTHILLVSGQSTMNFTSSSQLFEMFPRISYWRFEVIYSFLSETSSRSTLNAQLNEPPRNGSCSIMPQQGTTNTVFTVSCSSWFDEDGIKDYSIYGKKNIFAFSPSPPLV